MIPGVSSVSKSFSETLKVSISENSISRSYYDEKVIEIFITSFLGYQYFTVIHGSQK